MPHVISVSVDASDTTTYALDEDYQWRVTWISGGVSYVSTIRFDCVLEPYQPDVGLGDLVLQDVDIEERLTRQAAASDTANVRVEPMWRQEVRRGYSANNVQFWPKTSDGGWATVTGTPTYTIHKPDGTQITSGNATSTSVTGLATRTASTMAAQYVQLAWLDVSAMIRDKMSAEHWVRPRLIIDREKLRPVIAAIATANAYRAEGGGEDSVERRRALDLEAKARSWFAGLGPLSYDSSEDRTADATLSGWSSVTMGRSW